MKKSLLKILQHPPSDPSTRQRPDVAHDEQQSALQTMEKEMSFKYAVSTDGKKKRIEPFKFSVYRTDNRRSLIRQDRFHQIVERNKRFSMLVGDKTKPAERYHLDDNKPIQMCLLSDLLLMGVASTTATATTTNNYQWRMLHEPIPIRDVDAVILPDMGNLRHIMQLRVGSGELYALCAPSDVCRNAWVQDIKRLKQTSVAPTIQRRGSVIVRPAIQKLPSHLSLTAANNIAGTISNVFPPPAQPKLPAEVEELSKLPCKVYFWNTDNPAKPHWVPMGHARLELKIETDNKSQVLLYAVPYTGRPIFGATLTPDFKFTVSSDDPVQTDPAKLIMKISMQLPQFNGEHFDNRCRIVLVKVKGQDRVQRWSKLVHFLMAAAAEPAVEDDDSAASCQSKSISNDSASCWSASACSCDADNTSGVFESSIRQNNDEFDKGRFVVEMEQDVNKHSKESLAADKIITTDANLEQSLGIPDIPDHIRDNIDRLNAEIKNIFASGDKFLKALIPKRRESLQMDVEKTIETCVAKETAAEYYFNDESDDDCRSQASLMAYQRLDSDQEDQDDFEPLLPSRLDSLPLSKSEIEVSVGYWVDRMLDASESKEQQLRREISRLHELIRQLAVA